MKKIIVYVFGISIFVKKPSANTDVPVNDINTNVRYVKCPLRFKTYSSYLQYVSLKAFNGVNSANAFYRKENIAAHNFSRYSGSSFGTSTGSLEFGYDSDSFLTVTT